MARPDEKNRSRRSPGKSSRESSKNRSTSRGSVRRPRRRRPFRLATEVRADLIDLAFELDPAKTTFRGSASYDLEFDRRKKRLELHSVGLRIAFVRLHVGDEILRGTVEEHRERESISLRFDRMIPIGTARLELKFRGRVRRDLRGLYSAGSGSEAWLASQLCPTDARRLFPCFDEPGKKARYRIRITAPRDQTTLSNAPIESEQSLEGGLKAVQFATTPPLSSYLVAVAVGPFESSPVAMVGTTEIRVYTLPGRQNLAAFALESAVASLERLERWFDMPHPYRKLDLVALPAFAFGAMENAGAVFFRDSILLLDAKEANLEDRKRTAEVIAHELSHMWFGNWVTMAWWNDLWLNEAFATWMAYEIVNDWRPEWRIWLDFAKRREHALVMDALSSSHPIAPPVRSAEEAQENFDAITYSKGASVLRMLERYLGPTVFREGIRLYIRRHGEANAEAADLWSALGEVSGEKIEAIVSPWTLQIGFPIVSIDRKAKKESNETRLYQERFLALAPKTKTRAKTTENPKWPIPWVARIHRKKTRTLKRLLSRRRESLSRADAGFDWIYANDDESGFFRVDYGEAGRRALIANLSNLTEMERVGVVGNEWALCQALRVPIDSLLELIVAFGDEQDPDVLGAIEDVLSRIRRRLPLDLDLRLGAWIREIFEHRIEVIGLSPRSEEDDRERMQRARIFRIVGGLGHSEVVTHECERRSAQHFAEGTALAPELAGVILRIAARRGGAMLHAALLDASRKAETPQKRRAYLFALAGFNDPKLIARSLDAALDPESAPAPDRAQLIAEMLAHSSNAPMAWARMRKDWGRLEKQMPPILLARLAGATADALPTDRVAEILAFFDRHPLAAGSRVLDQIAEELKIARRFEREAMPALSRILPR